MKNSRLYLATVFICIFIFIGNKNVYADSSDDIIIGNAEVEKIIEEVCLERQVPCEIVKAIAYKESKMQQWYSDKTPVVSYNGNYLGIMQVSSYAGYDNVKLKNNIYYNLNAGIDILFLKWDMSINNHSVPKFESMDKSIIENWYFAIWAYNGWLSRNNPNSNAKAYQETVFDIAVDRYGAEISDIDTSLLPSSGLPAKRLIIANAETEHKSISFEVIEPVESIYPFVDIAENWAKDIIFEMYEKELINGITEEEFKPDDNMRIDEFCTLLSRYLKLSGLDTYENRFDSELTIWSKEHVDLLDENNLLTIYDNDVDFSKLITRGEVAQILAEYIIKFDTEGKYTDVSDVVLIYEDLPATLKEEDLYIIKILNKADVITGRDALTYAYNENITRAEVTAIIWKMMKSIILN